MTTINFRDVIGYKKLSACSSCDSHEYTLPFPLTREIEGFLAPLGPLKYPLDKVVLVKLETDNIDLQARLGRITLRIKFKKDPTQRQVFEQQLAAYIGHMMQQQDVEIVF